MMLTLATNLERSVDKNEASQDQVKDVKEEKKKEKEDDRSNKTNINCEKEAKMQDIDGLNLKSSPSINNNNIENCNEIVHQEPNIIMKSLLKKSSNSKIDDGTRIKHNRNVTFNQTVIVFCEEIETQSPSDLFGSPPIGYQDTISNIQSDNKKELLGESGANNNDHFISLGDKNNDPSAINDEEEDDDYDDDDVGDDEFLAKVGSELTTTTNNNKISSFIENIERLNRICSGNDNVLSNAIADGTKIDLDDYSELDDDYLIKQHLISNQSYICNEAMSDFDSDSESSTCFERVITNNNVSEHKVASNEYSNKNNETINSKTNKLTSARMKVSTINHSKRQQQSNKQQGGNNLTKDQQQKLDSNKLVTNISGQLSSNIINKNITAQQQKNDQIITKQQNEENRFIVNSSETKDDASKKNIHPLPVDNTFNSQTSGSTITTTKQPLPPLPPVPAQASQKQQQNSTTTLTNQIRKDLPNDYKANTTIITMDKRNIPVNATSASSSSNVITNTNTMNSQLKQQITTDVIQTQPVRTSQQAACHICRVIESSNNINRNNNLQNTNLINRNLQLSKTNETNSTVSSDQLQKQQKQQLPSNVPINNLNSLTSFDQSCSSCREVLARKQNLVSQNLPGNTQQLGPVTNARQNASNLTIHQQQQLPVSSYQLIHILDQNGNCMKTLSVIRPPQNLTQPSNQLNPGTRVFIAQNAVRLPQQQQQNQPTATIVSQQQQRSILSTSNNNSIQRPNSIHLNNNNTQNMISNINPQIKIVNLSSIDQQKQPIIISGTKNILVQAALSNNNNNNPSGIPQQTSINSDNRNNLRQHTIYYVRQPLNTHIVSHSTIDQLSSKHNSGSSKSFPDPHEIRRLDGLKGPNVLTGHYTDAQLNNNNNRISPQQTIQHNIKSKSNNISSYRNENDDNDDPTFGFSNRPAVKVVSVKAPCLAAPTTTKNNSILINNNNRSNEKVTIITSNNMPAIKQFTNRQNSTLEKVRETIAPPAPFAMMAGSQTLDRRQINQQQRTNQTKVTIPSTSSMSNIHNETIVINQTSKVNQHQPDNNNNSTKTKGKKMTNSFHRLLSNISLAKQI